MSRERVRPAGLGELPVLVGKRSLDCAAESPWPDRKRLAGQFAADEGVVAQAFDELTADARVERSDDAQPQRRDAGRRQGHSDKGPPEGDLVRVLVHEVGVGDAVWPADLEHPAIVDFEIERSEEILEDILDRDRLGA